MEKTEKIVKKNAKKAWHFTLRLVLMTIIMVDRMVGHKSVQVMGDTLRYQRYGWYGQTWVIKPICFDSISS